MRSAAAQYVAAYLPASVPGYQQEQGVTVASRLRPSYDPLGVRLDGFTLRSRWDETLGHNSNVGGYKGAGGSWVVRTAPSLSLNSDWSRDRLGASISVEDNRFLDQPRQSQTDWTAGIGGGLTLGRHEAILGYSHLSLHESAASVGAVASTTPLPYQVDDLRGEYTFGDGRISVSPRLDVQRYQFGDATVAGLTTSQAYQNRVVLRGGAEARYAVGELRSLVLVVEGIRSHYTDEPPGAPTSDSRSVLALAGVDYAASAVWRTRLLLGAEIRAFDAAQFGTRAAPVAEASVVWSPSGLTTVTGLLSRTIEDPAAPGTGGYTYTNARLVLDHEYRRDLLLRLRAGGEVAEYLRGGTQTSVTLGGGAQFLLNRNMRVALDYALTRQGGVTYGGSARPSPTGGPTAVSAGIDGSFTRNVITVSLRLAL